MIGAYEVHFARRLKERFGITYSAEVKNKLLCAIGKKKARFVARQDNKIVFWTDILGPGMYFVVDNRGYFVTCLFDSRLVYENYLKEISHDESSNDII